MPTTYKKATPSDAPTLKEISTRVIRKNYTSFLGAEMVDEFITSGLADKEIDDGIQACMLMFDDAALIGFAITSGDLLHLLMVDVPYQNRGYGRMLLQETENRLFETYDEIHLQTFEENSCAVQFYLKNGWRVTGSEVVPGMAKTMLYFSKSKDAYRRNTK